MKILNSGAGEESVRQMVEYEEREVNGKHG